MKKLLIIPAVIGLLAVPSIALASHSADDSPTLNVRREDKKTMPVATAVTPSVLGDSNRHSDDSDDDNNSLVVVPEGSVSLEDAKVIALGVYPDKTVKKVEIEHEHGTLVYSVRFSDSSRVDVRASDGAVVRSEVELDEDEDDSSDNSGSHSDDDSDDSDDDNSNRRSDD